MSNEHIRIDIVNNLLPKWLRDTIDVIGHAFFLLPLTIIMIVPAFRSSCAPSRSTSSRAMPAACRNGRPKSLIMIGFALLFVQGISELIKRIAVMRGLIPDPHATQVHALEAEVEHIVEAIEKR